MKLVNYVGREHHAGLRIALQTSCAAQIFRAGRAGSRMRLAASVAASIAVQSNWRLPKFGSTSEHSGTEDGHWGCAGAAIQTRIPKRKRIRCRRTEHELAGVGHTVRQVEFAAGTFLSVNRQCDNCLRPFGGLFPNHPVPPCRRKSAQGKKMIYQLLQTSKCRRRRCKMA